MTDVLRQLRFVSMLLCSLLSTSLVAAELPASESWTLTTTEGEQFSAKLLNATSTHWLLGRGDELRRFTPQEVVSVMHLHSTAEPIAGESATEKLCRVTLSNGDSIVGQLVALSETELTFRPSVLFGEEAVVSREAAPRPLTVSLEFVTQLQWGRPDGELSKPSPASVGETAKLQQDRLTLTNGDKIRGELTDFSATALTLETDAGAREFLLQELTELRFNPDLVIVPRHRAQRTLIRLRDGSRVTADAVQLVEFNTLLLKTELSGDWEVPLEAVESLLSLTENRIPLSERTPQAVTYTPFLTKTPRWQIDANVLGTPMRMETASYLTGIGMHSRTEIQWSLEANDRRFLTEIGIDDLTAGAGSVIFEVFTDDEAVYRSEIVRGSDRPQLIQIDLRGKKTLTLRVDFGNGGDVQDRANWGNALIFQAVDPANP